MAKQQPEIILHDLACTKGVCFSPAVWRIRLMLNYKRIPYQTVFLELPDIKPTLSALGITIDPSIPGSKQLYTVPAIHHLPSNRRIMDSSPISEFIEATYPDTPIQLTTSSNSRRAEIETQANAILLGPVFINALLPREMQILSLRSQEYFRRTREAFLGCRLEDLLDPPEKEEEMWSGVEDGLRNVSELIVLDFEARQGDGDRDGQAISGLGSDRGSPLPPTPTYTDFVVAGSLQCARIINEGVFERLVAYDGFKRVYEACEPYMKRGSF